jgi:RNA polymerase sigma factor for flagellar operon FliA
VIDVKRGIEDEALAQFRPTVEAIVNNVSKRIPAGSVDKTEMMQWGILGLLDALKKWDPKSPNRFKTYAEYRIRGAILDGLRDLDYMPRSVREHEKAISKVKFEFEKKFGREPQAEEAAKALGTSINEYFDLLTKIQPITFVPADNFIEDKEPIEPIELIHKKRIKAVLSDALDELPSSQRLIMSLYYFEELTFREIGKILRLTESRISQLHAKAIQVLRHKLDGKVT